MHGKGKAMTRCLYVLALSLLLLPAARAQPAEALEAAKRLVAASGLVVQLQSFPKQVTQDLGRMRGRVPEEHLAALGGAARESYDPAALQADIERALATSLPPAQMKKAIAWLESDAGRRVTRAEELASAAMTPEALQAHAAETRGRPADPRRAELLGALVAATAAVESTAKLVESVALGVAIGMDAMQPEHKRLGIAAVQARLRGAMPPEELRQSIAAAMPAMYGFIYREVSEADLEACLGFNRSADGRRYNEAVIAAFTEVLARASVRVGSLIEAAAKKKSV
jgi:hypothetical protein